MFSIMDAGAGPVNGCKAGAERACDQCKSRKVKCDMKQPCQKCAKKAFNCTYDRTRKKRGPVGERIESIRRQQHDSIASSTRDNNGSTSLSPIFSGGKDYSQYDLERAPSTPSEGAETVSQSGDWDASSLLKTSFPNNSIDPDLMPQATDLAYPTKAPHNISADPTGLTLAQTEPLLPSLPMDSPSGSSETFDTMFLELSQNIAATEEKWPRTVNEETLLPWIDVYFKRLHPTIPILNRTTMYQDMLLRKHYRDNQYGAMLLSLCAFAMTQPVQIHEVAEAPSRSAQARMLMEECIKMRVTADFGEQPTLEMVLTSFFLFACLFGSGQHRAARHRLREAVDLAESLGVHLPPSYESLDSVTRERWLRTYLILSVTERAYALQQRHPLGFRGRIGFNADFSNAHNRAGTADETNGVSPLLSHEPSDTLAITGLLFLAETFSTIDETIVECWNGRCKRSDGVCESFDRRRALQVFQAQHRAREVCLNGSIVGVQSSRNVALVDLADSQQADISVTHFWLLNRLWSLCLSHGLLRSISDHTELRYDFACHLAKALWTTCKTLPFAAMELHGVGLAWKIYEIAIGAVTALRFDANLNLQTHLVPSNAAHEWKDAFATDGDPPTVDELLQSFLALLNNFRGGDHNYAMLLETALVSSDQ